MFILQSLLIIILIYKENLINLIVNYLDNILLDNN